VRRSLFLTLADVLELKCDLGKPEGKFFMEFSGEKGYIIGLLCSTMDAVGTVVSYVNGANLFSHLYEVKK
jgi:hypothetical protein